MTHELSCDLVLHFEEVGLLHREALFIVSKSLSSMQTWSMASTGSHVQNQTNTSIEVLQEATAEICMNMFCDLSMHGALTPGLLSSKTQHCCEKNKSLKSINSEKLKSVTSSVTVILFFSATCNTFSAEGQNEFAEYFYVNVAQKGTDLLVPQPWTSVTHSAE